jgi:enoyl-CoA hydratase/carnithine racemase
MDIPMTDESFGCLRVKTSKGVAQVTIDNPPINLMDAGMFDDLDRLGMAIEVDESVRVIVFQSANPDFFIAHADLQMLRGLPRVITVKSATISHHQAIVDRFRTMPKVTIGKVEGIARGGGNEFLLALDMRFGSIGRAVFGQPEVALGFPPGCGGTQRLPRLIGRARALEAILGCGDYSATEAERYGWINRALAPDDIAAFVDAFALKVASFSSESIAAAKAAVNASEGAMHGGLCEELHCFSLAFATDAAQQRTQQALRMGFQTAAVERVNIEAFLQGLSDG